MICGAAVRIGGNCQFGSNLGCLAGSDLLAIEEVKLSLVDDKSLGCCWFKPC